VSGVAPKAAKGGRALLRALSLAFGALGLALCVQAVWIPAKAFAAQVLLERAFAQSLTHHRATRPWPWADTAPVARVTVPRLGISRVVLSGGSGQAMAFGPTELATTSARVTVLAAHRDTHFAFVRDLRMGDTVLVQRLDGKTRRYRVEAFQTVRHNRFAVPAGSGPALLALTTCYPFDAPAGTPWRRVAWARQAE
jgi:sortase A